MEVQHAGAASHFLLVRRQFGDLVREEIGSGCVVLKLNEAGAE